MNEGQDLVTRPGVAPLFTSDLMKGFVSARRVRINQEGCTIIRDFRFFLNLCGNGGGSCQISV